MNWKEFFKPDLRKIIIFGVLFVFSSFFLLLYTGAFFYTSKLSLHIWGFPLPYFTYVPEKAEGVTFDFCDLPPCPPRGFDLASYPNLFINLIFWYLLSCLVVWIYNKVKKK